MAVNSNCHTFINKGLPYEIKKRTVRLHILTVVFVVDLDTGLRWGEANRPLFVISNPCIPVKNTLCWSAVAFCACETIQLFSVVFCAARVVHKFDFRLLINEKKKIPMSWSSKDSCSSDRIYIFSPQPSSRV